jgi:hypothetical protein
VTSVWRYVKTAPLTYSWLVVLLITTIMQRSIPAHPDTGGGVLVRLRRPERAAA